jgi:hypothetical protein
MKRTVEVMKIEREDIVKIMLRGNWRLSVIEQAVLMIPWVDKSHRPFINPVNQIVQFSLAAAMTKSEAIAAMIDNFRCIETYEKFIESIEF